MTKCYVFFHLISGMNVRMPVTLNLLADLDEYADEFANSLAKCPFIHFVEDGKIVIVNMSNVAYIKITKAEEVKE